MCQLGESDETVMLTTRGFLEDKRLVISVGSKLTVLEQFFVFFLLRLPMARTVIAVSSSDMNLAGAKG